MKSAHYLWLALLALVAGIVIGAAYPFPPMAVQAVSLLADVLAIFRLARGDSRRGWFAWLAALLLFGLAGSTCRLQQTGPGWVNSFQGRTIRFAGRVDGFEEVSAAGLSRAAVRVTCIEGRPVKMARIQVTVAPGQSLPEYGAMLQGTGCLGLFEGPANPGDPDPRLNSRIKGLAARIDDASLMPLRSRIGPGSHIIRAAMRARKALKQVGEQTLPENYAALLNGITLGDSSVLDREWRLAFQRSGTLHILSVSGLHVSLVSGAAFWLLRRRRVPISWTLAAVVVCTGLYLVMTGLKPPGIRSGLMAISGLAGSAAGRKVSSARLLGLAALGMLAFDPLLLFDASFQLSVAATTGVCYVAPALNQVLGGSSWARPGQFLACSLGVQIAVAPWQALYFNTATPVALLANLIIVPLATSALYTGFAASLAGLFWLPLGRWLNGGTSLILRLMIGSARCTAAIPFGSFDVPAPAPLFFVIYYGAVAAALFLIQSRYRPGGGWALITLLLGVLWVAFTGMGWLTPSRVTILDVGQGNAALVEFRSGELGVVDGGPGAGGALMKALARKGRKRVDFMILSHAHSDHYGGLIPVLHNMRVDILIVPRGMEEGGEASQLLRLARQNRVKVVHAGAEMGFKTRSGACYLLWPQSGYRGDENGRSLVVMIEESGHRILLPGDVAREGLECLLGRYGRSIQCDAWTVPHHGSISAYCPDFYGLIRPSLSVISVGINRYGHPSPAVVEAIQMGAGHLSDTRSSGAIVMRMEPGGIRTVEWRKRGLFGLYMWRGERETGPLRTD